MPGRHRRRWIFVAVVFAVALGGAVAFAAHTRGHTTDAGAAARKHNKNHHSSNAGKDAASSPTQPTSFDPAEVLRLERATVLIKDLDADGNVVGTGSGTLISPHGMILTNAHVGSPDAPGLGLSEGETEPNIKSFEIALVRNPRRDAVTTYRATPVVADGYLDVAVLQITSTLSGSPVAPNSLHLASVSLGDSGGIQPGETIGVIGFPGIGGGSQGSVDFSEGTVSGFVRDPRDRLHGAAWIKTDARIAPGNSGGLAASPAGRVIGIPTQNISQSAYNPGQPQDVSEGRIRPINDVRQVINAALNGNGTQYKSPYFVPSTGQEVLRFTGFSNDSPENCKAFRQVHDYASGTSNNVTAVWAVSGVAPGEDWEVDWNFTGTDGSTGERFDSGIWKRAWATEHTCFFDHVPAALGDGRYQAELRIGPNLLTSRAGTGTTTVGTTGGPQT